MFDIKQFEKEYQNFILELKKKKKSSTENGVGIQEPVIIEPSPVPTVEQKKVLTVEDKYKKIMKLRNEIKKGIVIKTTDEKGKPIFLRLTKR